MAAGKEGGIMNQTQFAFLAQWGGNVKRFHNEMTSFENLVATHSWGVAMLCDVLTGHEPSVNLLRWAMYHDLAEQVTGDVPYTAKKRFPTLGSYLYEAECD